MVRQPGAQEAVIYINAYSRGWGNSTNSDNEINQTWMIQQKEVAIDPDWEGTNATDAIHNHVHMSMLGVNR